MEFTGLYNENTSDGQDLLKKAFESNENATVNIEFDNNPVVGSNGTQLEGLYGISKYVMTFPKDGKIGVAFTLEFIDTPVLTPAGAEGARAHGVWDCRGSSALGDGFAGVTVDGTLFQSPNLTAGLKPDDIVEWLAGVFYAEGTYETRSDKGILYIESRTFGVIDNGITVVDASTDTGITAVTQDFTGGTDPV